MCIPYPVAMDVREVLWRITRSGLMGPGDRDSLTRLLEPYAGCSGLASELLLVAERFGGGDYAALPPDVIKRLEEVRRYLVDAPYVYRWGYESSDKSAVIDLVIYRHRRYIFRARVASESRPGLLHDVTVMFDQALSRPIAWSCTCEDFKYRRVQCKHITKVIRMVMSKAGGIKLDRFVLAEPASRNQPRH